MYVCMYIYICMYVFKGGPDMFLMVFLYMNTAIKQFGAAL